MMLARGMLLSPLVLGHCFFNGSANGPPYFRDFFPLNFLFQVAKQKCPVSAMLLLCFEGDRENVADEL